MSENYFVYIITNKPNGILYVGVTNDIARRIHEHKIGIYKGFSKKYGLKTLVYFETYPSALEAIAAEKRMKKWNRAWKIKRILQTNPEWRDLTVTLNI